MSKSLFGTNFANREREREPRETLSGAKKDQQDKEQVSALLELGLLGRSGNDKEKSNKSRREKERDRDKAPSSGARVAGLQPKKGTSLLL